MESENIIRALWAVCIDISQGAIMRGLVYLLSCKSSAFTRQPGLVAGVQWRAGGGHPAAELETFPFKDPALCCPAQPSQPSPAQSVPAASVAPGGRHLAPCCCCCWSSDSSVQSDKHQPVAAAWWCSLWPSSLREPGDRLGAWLNIQQYRYRSTK